MPFEIRHTDEAHYVLKELRAFDRAKSLRLPAVAVLTAVLIAGIDCRADSGGQKITLVEQQGFSIRLKVRKVASLADESWLVLELENQSSPATFVEDLHYRIEYEAKPVGHDASVWSSGLC